MFGEPWGPDEAKDPYFGFLPGRGIHDVHANQGNLRQFRHDDGVWQDGGADRRRAGQTLDRDLPALPVAVLEDRRPHRPRPLIERGGMPQAAASR